jgi:hypothetical protein
MAAGRCATGIAATCLASVMEWGLVPIYLDGVIAGLAFDLTNRG